MNKEGDTMVGIEREGMVGVVELQKGPHNYVDAESMRAVADGIWSLVKDDTCRAVVIAAEGKSFCAGVNFGSPTGFDISGGTNNADANGEVDPGEAFRGGARMFYDEALRIYEAPIPVIGAVHGAAVGGGAGLALACDLRVICPEAFITTNFVKLGIHQGFGLSVTLPELVGPSRALDMFLTGRRVYGEEALTIGLADRCVPRDEVRTAAVALATEIAANAPLAVAAVRATLKRGLADRVREVLKHELEQQAQLTTTSDAAEGIAAVFGRRDPTFTGR